MALSASRGQVPKGKSKLMKPSDEKNTVADILRKNKGAVKKNKKKQKSEKGKKGTKPRKKRNKRATQKDAKGKKGQTNKKGKKGKKAQEEEVKQEEVEQKEEIDPYLLLKKTDPKLLIKMFLNKLVHYPLVLEQLGEFGDQLQSSMINFAKDVILPQLMSTEHVQRFSSIINDRKLIYLLRQSFIRWLMVHRGQMKLIFKRKGDENAKQKLKYSVVVTKNHIIQKLASTLHNNASQHTQNADIKDIISKLPTKTKLAYLHYLRSDIKTPFLAQLQTPIPNTLLPNTKCRVPSIGGKMPQKQEEKEEKDEKQAENVNEYEMHNDVSKTLHSVFEGYKDCVLLSEKQILVDVLKTQYKLIQNAIDDYGRIRWMDAPIDHGHVGLMQRELIRDHLQIIAKCNAIEADFRKKLEENISEVNKMRVELKKRKEMYLDLIEKKCFYFLRCKLSAIHEEIERKRQAIALHEKKRENYLNHAKESLKNEQNMRKGVDLVEQTYHKYLRQLTKAKIEHAVIDEKLDSDSFYMLQEKLNALRNKNDRYWYWYKKEKEIYSKSIKAFSRMNRFFKRIEEYLLKEYGQESQELIMFREEYYKHVLEANVDRAQEFKHNQEIFDKKKISDIEMIYAMKKKNIQLPPHNESIMNRLYTRMKPAEMEDDYEYIPAYAAHERRDSNDAMFLNNQIKQHQDRYGEQVDDDTIKKQKEDEEEQKNKEDHVNDTDSEPSVASDAEDQGNYIATDDYDIFGDVDDDEAPELSHNMSIAAGANSARFSVVSAANELLAPEEKQLLYEDSQQYHHDYDDDDDDDEDDDDEDRPGSTIFKGEEEQQEQPIFFSEPRFFNKRHSTLSTMNNIKEDEEEVLEVSGLVRLDTTNIDDHDIIQPDDDDEEFEDDDDDDFEDDDSEEDYDDEPEYMGPMTSLSRLYHQ